MDSIIALREEDLKWTQNIFFWDNGNLSDKKDNVSCLSRIEFAYKAEDPSLPDHLSAYFSKFGHKDSCFSYLQPYLHPFTPFAKTITTFIESQQTKELANEEQLAILLTAYKLNEHFFQHSNPSSLNVFPSEYLRQYGASKQICQRPLGDFIILAVLCIFRTNAQEQVTSEQLANAEAPLLVLPYEHLMDCTLLILAGLRDDDLNFILKLFAIFLLRDLGAVSFALSLYNSLNVKFIQLDILSYVILDWIPLLGFKEKVFRAQKGLFSLYDSNDNETPELLAEAYKHGSFSQVPEFIDLHLQLRYSIQRKICEITTSQLECLQLASKSNIEQFFVSLRLPTIFKTIIDNRSFLDLFPTWNSFPTFSSFLRRYSPKETSWIETCYAILLAMKSCFVLYESLDELIVGPASKCLSEEIILSSQICSLLTVRACFWTYNARN